MKKIVRLFAGACAALSIAACVSSPRIPHEYLADDNGTVDAHVFGVRVDKRKNAFSFISYTSTIPPNGRKTRVLREEVTTSTTTRWVAASIYTAHPRYLNTDSKKSSHRARVLEFSSAFRDALDAITLDFVRDKLPVLVLELSILPNDAEYSSSTRLMSTGPIRLKYFYRLPLDADPDRVFDSARRLIELVFHEYYHALVGAGYISEYPNIYSEEAAAHLFAACVSSQTGRNGESMNFVMGDFDKREIVERFDFEKVVDRFDGVPSMIGQWIAYSNIINHLGSTRVIAGSKTSRALTAYCSHVLFSGRDFTKGFVSGRPKN